jgi:hypothetical protein
MTRGKRHLASIFVSVALMAPLGALAIAAPQDDHERHEREEREEREHRVYDPYHRDYHNWDQREDGMYRRWLDERHERHVDYQRLKHRQQEAYWRWRHEHEEHERMEHQ